MKSLSFALVTFIALCFSVVSLQAQTTPSSACQKICKKVCDKSTAATKVVKPDTDKSSVLAKEETAKAMNVSLVDTKPAAAKGKANCDPANCKPADCKPVNCNPANCNPADCKKKGKKGSEL